MSAIHPRCIPVVDRNLHVLIALVVFLGTILPVRPAELEILIDFGGDAEPPLLGGVWNTIDTYNAAELTLRDFNGNIAPGVSVRLYGWSGMDTLPAIDTWQKDWVDPKAIQDYVFIRMGSIPAVYIGGLDVNLRYDLELAISASSGASGSWTGDYTVNMQPATPPVSDDSSLQFDPKVDGRVERDILRWHDIAPDSQAEIHLHGLSQAPDYQLLLNALRLSTSVPDLGPFSMTEAALEVMPGGHGLALSWESHDGCLYRLEKCTDLSSDTWEEVLSDIPATPPVNIHRDSLPSTDAVYFRVLRDRN